MSRENRPGNLLRVVRCACGVAAVLLLAGCDVAVRVAITPTVATNAPAASAERLSAQSVTPPLPMSAAALGDRLSAAAPSPDTSTMSITLAWDASPDPTVVGYRLYQGTRQGEFTNSVAVTNSLTATMRVPRGMTNYFAVVGFTADGVESPFSNVVAWYAVPQPLTNFVTISVTRRTQRLDALPETVWSQTLTNPPGDAAFFQTHIAVTNNAVTVLRLNSTTLLIANTNGP